MHYVLLRAQPYRNEMATHALIAPDGAKQDEVRKRIDDIANTRSMKLVTAAIGTVPESNELHNCLLSALGSWLTREGRCRPKIPSTPIVL
jgi:hypothetical protein